MGFVDAGESPAAVALRETKVLGPSGEPAGRFNSVWRLDSDGARRVVSDRGS